MSSTQESAYQSPSSTSTTPSKPTNQKQNSMATASNEVPNQEFTDIIANVPIHKHIGIVLDEQDYKNKTARGHFMTHHGLMTPTSSLHGGIIYSCCDTIAYAALIPLFDKNENTVTVSITVNVIRSVTGINQRVELRAKVLSKGRRQAFIESSMWWNNKLIATALVTKAIIDQLPDPLKKQRSKL